MTEHPKKKRKVAVASDQPCWTENDRNVLVRLVKQCQKLGSEGSSGSWKNFLKVCIYTVSYDRVVFLTSGV